MFVLIGNKSDLFAQEEVNETEGTELANKINAEFLLTSAKCNTGLTLLPEKIIEKCKKVYGEPEKWDFGLEEGEEISNKKQKKKCC